MAPTKITRIAAAIGFAFAASALSVAPVAAQESGGLFQSLLGVVGIAGPPKPAIEYRERPPLVVPPSRDLPPPVAPESLTGNPQWPDDATLQAERSRAQPYVSNSDLPPLTIEEMRAGRRVGGGGTNFQSWSGNVTDRPLTPEEMRITHRSPQAAQGLTRRYLTDPPNAFLQPVPSN
jgi:hypothetical protein